MLVSIKTVQDTIEEGGVVDGGFEVPVEFKQAREER